MHLPGIAAGQVFLWCGENVMRREARPPAGEQPEAAS